MKPTIKLFPPVFLLLIFVITSCKTEPAKIGLLMANLSSERWTKEKVYITERVKELGGEVIVKVADNDQRTQVSQARELIDKGVGVIIIVAVDQSGAAEIVDVAHQNEVKVIAYERVIKNCDLDFYITTNTVKAGELQAKYMTELSPKGNYVLMNGDKKDNNSLLMFIGQMNELDDKIENGDIRIVYSEFTDSWTSEASYKQAQVFLNLKDSADVIICGNDQLAYGVNEALQEKGLMGKVRVIGQDAELKAVQEIVKGNLAGTIYKPFKKMSHKAAEIAMTFGNGEELVKDYTTVSNGKRLVPSYQLDPVLVNKENITSTVIASGYHTSEEVYQ